jgi:tetratricopeptide (TPR) repeat protein
MARVNLAYLHYRRAEYMDALTQLEIAAEYDPDNQVTLYNLGLVYTALGQYKVAEECFLKALSLSRHPDTLYFALGDLFSKQEKYRQAIDYYQEALVWLPYSPDIYLAMGEAYKKLGRLDDAAQAYSQALLYDPELADEVKKNSVE